jgi:hypothetical protein
LAVDEVMAGVGSGLNGKRLQLARLPANATATTVVVEHRGRLVRFGVGHLEAALSAWGGRVVVVDPGQGDEDVVPDMDDLVRDVTEVPPCPVRACTVDETPRTGRSKHSAAPRNDVGPAAPKEAARK